jgi:hypothetical protein
MMSKLVGVCTFLSIVGTAVSAKPARSATVSSHCYRYRNLQSADFICKELRLCAPYCNLLHELCHTTLLFNRICTVDCRLLTIIDNILYVVVVVLY